MFIYIFANVNKKNNNLDLVATAIQQQYMKKIYCIERYVISHKTGAWTLTSNFRFDYREKNRFIKEKKKSWLRVQQKGKSLYIAVRSRRIVL